MKNFIFITIFVLIISSLSFTQDIIEKSSSSVSLLQINSLNLKYDDTEENPLFFFLSYGILPNEVVFNKDFDKSYTSSVSHEISSGISIIGRAEKYIMGEFTLSGFYHFSKQHSGINGNFSMEYKGFGIKAPRISVGVMFKDVEVKLFFPLPLDFSWYKFNINNNPAQFTNNENKFLDNFNDKYKFSSGREYGLGINFGKHTGLNLGYECRLFYPSYKLLQQQATNLIEYSLYPFFYALTYTKLYSANSVTDAIAAISLLLVPEVVSFALLQFRKHSINWPFSSEAPLYYNALKISANFYF